MNLFLRYGFYISLFFLIASCSRDQTKTQAVNPVFNSVEVKNLEGKIFPVSDLIEKNHISVVYFLMPGCPMCEAYTLTINQLDKKFSAQGISFYGIFASDYYSDEEIISFRNDFNINIPFYRDINFKLTNALGATVTPEVFVLDSAATVLYSGSLDNWAFAAGKMRLEATEFFLNDALENIVSGKPVGIKSTKAYGCIIE